MTLTLTPAIAIAIAGMTLLFSILALRSALRLNAYQKHEYEFFIREHQEKLGVPAGRWAKLKAWNAALGGPSPRWHWIRPVISPRDSFKNTGN